MEKTIHVLEHLSYVMECVLVDCMGEAKTELLNLIESLEKNRSYRIDQNMEVAGQLKGVYDNYINNNIGRGNSELSGIIRGLWKRIMDGQDDF